MYEMFKNYCRLCGKYEDDIKNIFNPENTCANLCNTIEKHFALQIESNNQVPTTICNECTHFILKLIEFERIVLRTQEKFQCYEAEQQEDEERIFEEDPLEEDLLATSSLESKQLQLSFEIEEETFSTQNKLRRKYLKSNSGEKKRLEVRKFICDECGKAFKGSGDLSRHKEFHRDEDDTPFDCSICGKKFKSKLVRAMHEKNHGDNRCTCSICGLELKTKNTLRGHMLMHSEELQFKCEHCEKRFRHKKNLSVHLLTHSGVQPFTCTFCNQSFSLRFNLRTHQKKLHPEETANYEREGKATIITDVVKKKFACGQRKAKS